MTLNYDWYDVEKVLAHVVESLGLCERTWI